MGDAETATVTEYTNAVPDDVALDSAASMDAAYATPDVSSTLGETNAYNTTAADSVIQDAPLTSAYDDTPAVPVAEVNENQVTQETTVVVESTHAGAYDSVDANGVDDGRTYTSVGHDVNGDVSNNVSTDASEQQFDESPALSTEEGRLWSIVKANSSDFNSWTALIEETERVAEENILKIRKIYDAFLAEFPLCYGYWKKYAEHESRLGYIEKVYEVFERGVGAVTYSVDMWLHYCIFAMSTYGDPEKVRRLFERGLAYVGTDYLSYPLWDKYIEYEYSLQQWCHLAVIYTRILENPNQQLDRYMNSFKELAGSRPLSELQTAEEATVVAATKFEASTEGTDTTIHNDATHNTDSANAGITDGEELEKYVAIREEIYKKAKEFDSKIIGFETAIRRPYFHVRPLNGAELENWHNYLDFIESDNDINKIVKLYERCLIACANYCEYWIRYVLCMEASGTMDLANNALARATQIFVKRQPEIHLFCARFKEQNEDITGARASYQFVHSELFPGHLEAIINHANMEHRQGNLEEAFSVYEKAIATEKERGNEHSQTLPMLVIQYARFQYLVAGNPEKAREIIDGALEHIQLSKPFLEALIHHESIQLGPKRISFLDPLVEKFVMPNSDASNASSTTDREDLSCIYLEFLGLFGDLHTVKKASDRHAKLFSSHKSTSELKKRSAEDFLSSDKAKLAKAYAAQPSPAQAAAGAYPNAQNQWAAGYGVQTQPWPQVPQGQQYPGYAQQGAYAGYSGYGNAYTAPQVPVSAPQTAAYGAYPASYPAQAQQPYVQQGGYAQVSPSTAPYPPAPVAVQAPAQQPALGQQPAQVPQAYYGSYY